MTYDVVVWEGKRPANADEAEEILDELMEAYEDSQEPPVPAISALVSRLLARWPDIDEPGGDNSPWAMSSIQEDATGPLLYVCMTTSPLLDEAVAYVAQLAQEHDLVCYDPQLGELR